MLQVCCSSALPAEDSAWRLQADLNGAKRAVRKVSLEYAIEILMQ